MLIIPALLHEPYPDIRMELRITNFRFAVEFHRAFIDQKSYLRIDNTWDVFYVTSKLDVNICLGVIVGTFLKNCCQHF